MDRNVINLLMGRRHQVGMLMLARGQLFMETIEPGGMVAIVLTAGTATISRQRSGSQAPLHISPHVLRPVLLNVPGTYCVSAQDHVLGFRFIRLGGQHA